MGRGMVDGTEKTMRILSRIAAGAAVVRICQKAARKSIQATVRRATRFKRMLMAQKKSFDCALGKIGLYGFTWFTWVYC